MSNVQQLRKRIAKLTGREPQSDDESYLKQRLADLEATSSDEQHIPTSFSLTRGVKDAIAKLADKEKCSASEIVRRALRVYAREQRASERVIKMLGGES